MKALVNKKARFNYEIIESFEAGIKLQGSEVKSLRASKVSFEGSWCYLRDNSIYIKNLNIEPYQGSTFGHEPKRERQLLLTKKELRKISQLSENGKTIVPLKIFTNKNWFKLQIAVVKGKKEYDKRQTIKKRDQERSNIIKF